MAHTPPGEGHVVVPDMVHGIPLVLMGNTFHLIYMDIHHGNGNIEALRARMISKDETQVNKLQ